MPSLPIVALFRPRHDALASAEALAERGLRAAIAPVVEVHPIGAQAPPEPFDFVVATSAKALDLASSELLAATRGLPLYAVGQSTAAAAQRVGLALQSPPAADVASLLPSLTGATGRALYLAGRDRKPDLEIALAGRIVVVAVYEARARAGWDEAEAQALGAAAAALHYSERSARLAARFAEAAGLAGLFRRIPQVCLARDVAAPLAAFGVARALWPRRPVESALFDTLESALAD